MNITPQPYAVREALDRWGRGELSDAEYLDIQRRHLPNSERVRQARYRARPAKMGRPEPAPTRAYERTGAVLNDDPRLSDSARRLVRLLVRLCRGRPSCTAYVAQLADMLQCSVRTVRYAQKRAAAFGYLSVQHTRNGSLNDANIYRPTEKALPPPPPKRRRGRPARAPGKVKLQNFAPHEEGPSASSPLPPPREGERSGVPLVAALPRGRRRAASPPAGAGAPEAPQGSPGGEGASSVPRAQPPPP